MFESGNLAAAAAKVAPPLLECDIVMAGGVTSGIIYPGAVAMIARRYSFRSIGGTSVGAIAAAVTAAAEFGRRSGANPQGFVQLAELHKTLGQPGRDGHTRLFHLFTPEPATSPLFGLLMPVVTGRGVLGKMSALVGGSLASPAVLLPAGVAILAGILLLAAVGPGGFGLLWIVALIAALALVTVVWLAALLLVLQRLWLPAWRTNGYGMCTGNAPIAAEATPETPAFESLTPWIHRQVQLAAGLELDGAPLTFGDLWRGSATTGATEMDPAAPRAIELAMVTSDISRNRMAQLPFLETPSPIYVETAVLERYFPPNVASWMKNRAGTYDKHVVLRDDVVRLPHPGDIPVVFGARLSLSFPVLLSALPLLTPDFASKADAGGRVSLRRIWFSDGGLTSNLPIHFFDSPLPSRPTFCLNLVDFNDAAATEARTGEDISADSPDDAPAPAGTDVKKPVAVAGDPQRKSTNRPQTIAEGDPQPGAKVWELVSMNRGNRMPPAPFTAFDTTGGAGFVSFLQTVLNTARGWSDNQLLLAPGVRDRVVNIALRDDEGGLNLDMSAEIIADLDLRGRAAGMLIAARFDPKTKQDPETGDANVAAFANHRWVRYRNFMAAFEDMTRRFARSRRGSDDAAASRGESLLDTMIDGKAAEKPGYPAPAAARPFYHASTDNFEQLALQMAAATRANPVATFDRPHSFGAGGTSTLAGAAPRPKMRLRLRPLVDNDPRAEQADLPKPGSAS